MTSENEVPIGALRADATEKPEATVMRDFARFAHDARRKPPRAAVCARRHYHFASCSVFGDSRVADHGAAKRGESRRLRSKHAGVYNRRKSDCEARRAEARDSAFTASSGRIHMAGIARVCESGRKSLVTGPVERDPHWHRVDRAASIGLDAQVEPLTTHNAEMRVKDQIIQVSFDADAQSWLEALHFKDGQQLKDISYGTGRIFWAPYPVELAEGAEPAAALYSAVFGEIGVQPLFELKSPRVHGVLIYPTILQDSVLYVMVSETDQDADVDLIDKTSGAELKLRLPAQRAAMAVIRKSDGAITAKYGF